MLQTFYAIFIWGSHYRENGTESQVLFLFSSVIYLF